MMRLVPIDDHSRAIASAVLTPLAAAYPLVELFYTLGTAVRLSPSAGPRIEQRAGVQVRAVGAERAHQRWSSRVDAAGVAAACADLLAGEISLPPWSPACPTWATAEVTAWSEAVKALRGAASPPGWALCPELWLWRGARGAMDLEGGAAREWTEADLVVDARHVGGLRLARRFRVSATPGTTELRTLLDRVGAETRACAEAGPVPPPVTGAWAVGTGPQATAALVHELVGHALEADHILAGVSPFAGCALGEEVAPSGLTVRDTPEPAWGSGALLCDDEGAIGLPVTLVQHGRLAGVLHDRATALACNAPRPGCGRREDHRAEPAPRMRNLVVDPGPCSADALRSEAGCCLWIDRVAEARAALATGRFRVQVERGAWLRPGRPPVPVRDVVLVGDIRAALDGLLGVADDLVVSDETVLCAKGGVVSLGHSAPSALWRAFEVRA